VGSDGSQYDGDGVTPIQSALAMKQYVPHADTLVLEDVGHFCWSDVFGGDVVAPGELNKSNRRCICLNPNEDQFASLGVQT
jgi:hypothetical protein